MLVKENIVKYSRNFSITVLVGFATISSGFGQATSANPTTVAATPAPVTALAAKPTSVTIPINTIVRLKTSENLSSETNRVNDIVFFEVLEDVKVNDIVVIPRGTAAIGSVAQAKQKGMMGHAGKLDIVLDRVELPNSQKISISADKSATGNSHGKAVAVGVGVTAVLFWPAAPFFLLRHGNDVTIPEGTQVTAFTSGEAEIRLVPITAVH
jgi:hypothetical protein